MTFEETMGLISDRYGRRITVTISGRHERGPVAAMHATGTLTTGFTPERLEVMHENVPEAVIHVFSFEEAPETRVYFDPSEFRDAKVHLDELSVHVGQDVEIKFRPALN